MVTKSVHRKVEEKPPQAQWCERSFGERSKVCWCQKRVLLPA
jgi:hypothetical protein